MVMQRHANEEDFEPGTSIKLSDFLRRGKQDDLYHENSVTFANNVFALPKMYSENEGLVS
jgi:hypothetical protein